MDLFLIAMVLSPLLSASGSREPMPLYSRSTIPFADRIAESARRCAVTLSPLEF